MSDMIVDTTYYFLCLVLTPPSKKSVLHVWGSKKYKSPLLLFLKDYLCEKNEVFLALVKRSVFSYFSVENYLQFVRKNGKKCERKDWYSRNSVTLLFNLSTTIAIPRRQPAWYSLHARKFSNRKTS